MKDNRLHEEFLKWSFFHFKWRMCPPLLCISILLCLRTQTVWTASNKCNFQCVGMRLKNNQEIPLIYCQVLSLKTNSERNVRKWPESYVWYISFKGQMTQKFCLVFILLCTHRQKVRNWQPQFLNEQLYFNFGENSMDSMDCGNTFTNVWCKCIVLSVLLLKICHAMLGADYLGCIRNSGSECTSPLEYLKCLVIFSLLSSYFSSYSSSS